ncbi:integrator complex subunit 5 omd [Lycorma delicatula]|uniref:integrator complex subunit 5 omd n=1 Tax=Lycorma delicatula TaxID=130591 RepID=UPI003F5150A5
MSGGTSVIRPVLSQQDLLAELRLFIAGATRSLKVHPLELARKALSLLKTLPAARDAVLEYFCTLFYSAVSNYVKQLKAGKNTTSNEPQNQDEMVISEIHSVLCNFVSSNPEAWAPIISTWSLELLGELSSKFAGQALAHTNGGLNESMHIWMSCRATRTLIEINTQCLSCLMHSNTDACINALLDTSVHHSPHFDWVVAHVGSCFPHTVITRVLSCGLRDFSQKKSDDSIVAKMNSVVGILGHLAGSHFLDIRNALLELFQWSLQTGDRKQERVATVPYLLKLASLSPTLLRALNADVLQSLNCDVLGCLADNGPAWATFFQGRQPLLDLIVHLMLNSEQGAEKFISLLLESASHPNKNVKLTALEILELLLKDVDLLVRLKGSPVPFLTCVQQKLPTLQPLLLSDEPLYLQTAVRLLTFLGYQNPSMLPGALSHVMMRPMTDRQLAALVEVAHFQQDQDCFAQAVMLSLRSCLELEVGKPVHLWLNLEKLLREQKSKKLALSGLWPNLGAIAESLCECRSPIVSCTIATVLELVLNISQENLSTQLTIWLTHASVAFFYTCLSLSEGYQRSQGTKIAGRLLQRLATTSNVSRALALRELLETALFHPPSYLFGATGELLSLNSTTPSVSLLQENQKQGTSSMLAQRHSSVFHAGVIGCGLRSTPSVPEIKEDQVACNTQCLIAMLRACCLNENVQASLDAVISLALLLVELISPDVMYNGLPWPEEDFCKVTVERDLCIRRLFNWLPLLWTLLKFIASHRPALCYCSVLLRAVTATLIGQWSTAGQQRQQPGEDKQLVEATVTLLQVMALGQLLPPPLSCLSDVIPHLPPLQVVMVLRDCVWNYMRDHVPSPALFARDASGVMWRDPALARPAKQYTETLRLVLQRNIATFGHLYSLLFLSNDA